MIFIPALLAFDSNVLVTMSIHWFDKNEVVGALQLERSTFLATLQYGLRGNLLLITFKKATEATAIAVELLTVVSLQIFIIANPIFSQIYGHLFLAIQCICIM